MTSVLLRNLGLFNPLLIPKTIYHNRDLLEQLVKRNVVFRYRGSALGLVWSIVQPLVMLCVYTFVFSVVFKARWGMELEDSRGAFAIVMFCGMAIYNIFSESVNLSSMIIVGNPNYVKKVIFPLEILPISQAFSSFLLGGIWFVLLFLGVVFVFGSVSWTMLLLPVILFPLLLLVIGLGLFVSSLTVYLRDISYVVGVLLQILFFMTPIFYPLNAVPERFQWVLRLNPLTMIIEEGRKVFLFGMLPDWRFFIVTLVCGIIVAQLGFAWFAKTRKGFADVL